MKDQDPIRSIGEITVTLITLIIPMLLVIGFYENWHDFIKWILIIFFVGDVIAIGAIVHMIEDE